MLAGFVRRNRYKIAITANGYEVVLIPKGTPEERAAFLERQLGY